MRLMREGRCYPAGERDGRPPVNSWAGSCPSGGFERYWGLRSVVEGPVEKRPGYLSNSKELDAMLRGAVLPLLRERAATSAGCRGSAAAALIEAFPEAARRCPPSTSLVSLELDLSPYLSIAVDDGDSEMILLTKSFEFSAAHRLYCPEWSDEDNHRMFGKCSNVNGHGHNYVLEVTLRGSPDERRGTLADGPRFDRIVREQVIDRFDHKHLNLDCPEFEALNPSVENITRVIWRRLEGAFEPARLTKIRVWETAKTYAECTGDE